jgi:hypothetical protein
MNKLHYDYFLFNTARKITSRRMLMAGHVIMHGEISARKISAGKPQGKEGYT